MRKNTFFKLTFFNITILAGMLGLCQEVFAQNMMYQPKVPKYQTQQNQPQAQPQIQQIAKVKPTVREDCEQDGDMCITVYQDETGIRLDVRNNTPAYRTIIIGYYLTNSVQTMGSAGKRFCLNQASKKLLKKLCQATPQKHIA